MLVFSLNRKKIAAIIIVCMIVVFVVVAFSVISFCEAEETQSTGLNYIVETSKQEGIYEKALDVAGVSEYSCTEKIINFFNPR